MYRTAYGHIRDVSTENRRQQIARAALEVVDRDGLDALSMRRLAAELGVGTMTLYGYFRTKDELLDAVAEEAQGGYRPTPADGDWRDTLRKVARGWHRGLARHPSIVQLRLRRPVLGPEAFRGTEVAMTALVEAGFPPAEAARAFRVLFLYVFSTAAFNDPEVTAGRRRQLAQAQAALPDDEFPTLTALPARAIADSMGGEEQFEYGLDVLLDGLAARLNPSSRDGA
jgi:AcrR family transcriptional regulator